MQNSLFTGELALILLHDAFENVLHITTNLDNCQSMPTPKYSHVHVLRHSKS